MSSTSRTFSVSARTSLVALALASLVSTGACNGCDDPLTGADGNKLPVDNNNTDEGGPRELLYVGEDAPELIRNASTSLRFTLKELATGAPVVGEAIAIELSGSVVTLGATALPTDEGGAINVPVTAGDLLGEAVITAKAMDVDGKVLEAGVIVKVVEDPVAGLHVAVSSEARVEVGSADVRVYAGVNPPTCATLLAAASPPNGLYTATFAPLPNEDVFTDLTTGWRATVLARGENEYGTIVASGCEETGELPGGVITDVDTVLDQGKTRFEGDYDVLMHMALGDALPSPYDDNVELITALLADPAGYALYFALREADRQMGTEFVTRNGVEQTYRQVEQDPSNFPTWQWGQGELDQLLIDQLGQTYIDITDVGAGVRDVVTDFEVGGRFSMTQNGADVLLINEEWQDVVLYWPLGCTEPDGTTNMACARRPLQLADDDLAPVITAYGAVVDFAPTAEESETFSVTSDAHGLTLRYGALLLAILNQVVFPALPGDIAADNFGDVLSNIVGCANIAIAVSDDAFVQSLVEGFCEAGLDIAAAEIEDQLLGLEVGAAQIGQEGLSAQGVFTLVDADHDLETELVSAYAYDVQWFDPNDAAASEDISAPITGAGRRAWTPCVDDGTCGAGSTCQVRGSYLRIAALEQGCNRAIGDLAGGAACTHDDDCGIGLCAPVGAGGTMACAELCDASADCAAGFACMQTGGLLSLDSVMDGLGDIGFPGCAAF
jgi:hypothetical protein